MATTEDRLGRGTMLALVAMALGVFVIANDFTALSVAVPQIEKSLGTDLTTAQWVINGYALVFGVLIVTGGRLADLYGRKRIFMVGSAIFAAFSVLGGFSPNIDVLIACRMLMGIGGAMMWPAILGMTYAIVPDEQGRAGGRPDPRCRGPRERGRPDVRWLPDRRAELALGLLRQPADRAVRDVRDPARGGGVLGGGHRPAARLPGRRGADDRRRLVAARARRGIGSRLHEPDDPRALRDRRRDAGRVRGRRVAAGRPRARASGRAGQPRLHRGLRGRARRCRRSSSLRCCTCRSS